MASSGGMSAKASETKTGILSQQIQEALKDQKRPSQSLSELAALLKRVPTAVQTLINSILDENKALKEENLQLQNALQADDGETFHPFPRLPTEMRDAIWDLASNDGRLIRLGLLGKPNRRYATPTRLHCLPSKVPSVLHVSKESRERAVKCYELCREPGPNGKSRWFNHNYDILYIPQDFDRNKYLSTLVWHSPNLPNHDGFSCSKVRRIAFDADHWNSLLGQEGIKWMTNFYPGLEELVLLVQTAPPHRYWDPESPTGSFIVVEGSGLELVENSDNRGDTNDDPYMEPEDRYESTVYRSDYQERVAQELTEEPVIDDLEAIGIPRSFIDPDKIDTNPPYLSKITNPWVEEGKTPPKVTILSVLPASTLSPRYQFNFTRDFCIRTYGRFGDSESQVTNCGSCEYCKAQLQD